MKKNNYQSPLLEVINVNIEKGFAASEAINAYAEDGEAGMLQEGETYDF